MFAKKTKDLLKSLGAQNDLIYNTNLNFQVEMFSLVKVQKKFVHKETTYSFTECTIFDLYTPELAPTDFAAQDFKEPRAEILVKDFHVSSCFGGGVEVGGGSTDVQVDVTGEDHVGPRIPPGLQPATQTLTFLLSCRMLEQKVLDILQLKEGEKLAFVKQRVFNTGPVDVSRETSRSGSIGTKFLGFLSVGVKGEKADKYKFTVPENKTFAFALKELIIEDGVLRFSSESSVRVLDIFSIYLIDLCNEISLTNSVISGLQSKQNVLTPLVGRRYLLRDLRQILEDRDALSLLEDALDQIRYGEYQRPQSEAVVWFMALLDVSSASKDLIEAVHLLVSALEALPDNTAAVLAKGGLETLNCIISMMGQLVLGQGRQLQPQLRPLQEDEELHWVTKFLCSANNLSDLVANWDYPDSSPEGVLELLYVSVQGLGLMQHNVRS
uniref:Gasdermin pore forming domain-containing protein n=1 Tax=Poecilia formosa TaxID=48698 RepID=A0A096LRD5_POEFO